jgi:stage V sporulation protein G
MKDVSVERIHKLNGNASTKAFCDIKLMDEYVVKGLRIVEGKDGLFLSMPQAKGKDGKWYDTFHPLSQEARKELQSFVLEEYKGSES